MKTTKYKTLSSVVLLVALWTTQTALAWYDPSTQRWLTRDPIGEPGFQVLRAGTRTPRTPAPPSLWINRELDGDSQLYAFVNNSPISYQDAYGLSFWSQCKDFCKDLVGAGKEVAKDKAKDKIKDAALDKIKEIFAEIYGGSFDEARKACDDIKCHNAGDANWTLKCQQCAAYKCAFKSNIIGAKTCLEAKFLNCDGGIAP